MRTKIFTSLLLMLFSLPAMSQDVPNGNFAEWEERYLPAEMGGASYVSPSGYWDTFNILAPGCVTKAEGRTAGSTAALLESKVVDMSVTGMDGEVYTTSLLATCRFLSKMGGGVVEEGVPCKAIPAHYLTFWYKYQPVGKDTAQVFIQFNEDLAVEKDVTRTLKFRREIPEAASDWTLGYIDLTQDEDGENPSGIEWSIEAYFIDITSSISGLSSSTEGRGADAPGSKLWITDLQFADDLMSVRGLSSDSSSSYFYNLLGQRVNPNQKGLLIINGKKVLLK